MEEIDLIDTLNLFNEMDEVIAALENLEEYNINEEETNEKSHK